jgi:hypothetical protein
LKLRSNQKLRGSGTGPVSSQQRATMSTINVNSRRRNTKLAGVKLLRIQGQISMTLKAGKKEEANYSKLEISALLILYHHQIISALLILYPNFLFYFFIKLPI